MPPSIPGVQQARQRILELIGQTPDGMTVERLIGEMKKRRWCEADLQPQDLGLNPHDILRAPRYPSNDP